MRIAGKQTTDSITKGFMPGLKAGARSMIQLSEQRPDYGRNVFYDPEWKQSLKKQGITIKDTPLAAAGAYAGGLGPFAKGSTMFGGKLASIPGAGFGSSFLGGLKTGFMNPLMQGPMATRSGGLGRFIGSYIKQNPGKAALLGLGATAIAAPFFMGDEEEVDEGTPFTDPQASVEAIRDQAKAYYSDPTKSALYFMPPKSAVRFGGAFAGGGLADIPREGYR